MSDAKPPVDTISSYEPSLWEAIKESYRLGTEPSYLNEQDLPTQPLKDWVEQNVPLGRYAKGLIPDTKAEALVQAATALIPTPARSAGAQKAALEAVKPRGPSVTRTAGHVLEDWFGMHPSLPTRIERVAGKKVPPTPAGPLTKKALNRRSASTVLDSDFVANSKPKSMVTPTTKTIGQTVEDVIEPWGPWTSPNMESPWFDHVKKALIGGAVDAGGRLAKWAATPEGERVREPEAEAAQRWAEGRGASEQAGALESASGGSDQTVDPTYGSWKNKTADVSKMTPEELSAYVASLGGK